MGDSSLEEKSYLQHWRQWSALFRQHPWALKLLKGTNNFLTLLFYVSYAALLTWWAFKDPLKLILFIAVPAFGFFIISFWRKRYSKPRPYEIYDIDPLIPREGKGCSFPSRHSFSAFLIAGLWFSLLPPLASGLLICALLLGLCRIVGGVHFPQDVIVGGTCGLLCAFLCLSFLLFI